MTSLDCKIERLLEKSTSISELPFPKKGTLEHKLSYNCYLEQWIIPKGIIVKLSTTKDFGFVTLPKNCKDKRGFIIPKRIFKW
jgi:hypothetical protein